MTRPSLAGIKKRAAAATEGPWEASGSHVVTSWTGASDWSGPIDDRELVATASPADAALIADARTVVPALTAAVRDVLALHREGGEVLGYDAEGVLDYIPACVECDQAWPCATVRALAAHLDLTDPEGDPT